MYGISAVFNYTLASNLSMSDSFGGGGGTPFNQLTDVLDRTTTSFTLQSGARVDGFSIGISDASFLSVGGTANASVINLDPDEYITSVTLHRGQRNGDYRIFYMSPSTNKNQTLSGGTMTNNAVTYTAPSGWAIAGFHGRAGSELDSVGVIYKKVTSN